MGTEISEKIPVVEQRAIIGAHCRLAKQAGIHIAKAEHGFGFESPLLADDDREYPDPEVCAQVALRAVAGKLAEELGLDLVPRSAVRLAMMRLNELGAVVEAQALSKALS